MLIELHIPGRLAWIQCAGGGTCSIPGRSSIPDTCTFDPFINILFPPTAYQSLWLSWQLERETDKNRGGNKEEILME